ncbi:hypothetical protein CORC01_03072 [Colletotrichum orchidophilum]|uniref:Uncharacterized protein n=1 Tax=Colletotrichum orchidophilum TaxID=1209926 RepID=A0A1G4BJG1_9PEZI|nr:uncharacterized protein CORC01_03072 [Colletotrichum orchidophilum]OHF01582.1 hypothetical protein CORC01_03072 [Colletotrichum orchidophilum]
MLMLHRVHVPVVCPIDRAGHLRSLHTTFCSFGRKMTGHLSQRVDDCFSESRRKLMLHPND